MCWRIVRAAMAMLTIVGVAGCGGGGGGDDDGNVSAVKASLGTAGLLEGGQQIGGVQMTLHIPLGVTVKTDPQTGEVSNEVVRLIGAATSGTSVGAVYVAPSETAQGELQFLVVNAYGFAPGEIIEIQLDITAGYFPVASDFSLSEFTASDLDGNLLTDLVATMTATIY